MDKEENAIQGRRRTERTLDVASTYNRLNAVLRALKGTWVAISNIQKEERQGPGSTSFTLLLARNPREVIVNPVTEYLG